MKEKNAKYESQRKERGFDDSETYTLYYTIAKFVYPRLKAFIAVVPNYGSPYNSLEEWKGDLLKMEKAFAIMQSDEECLEWTPEQQLIVDTGLELFHKNFLALWW